MDPKVLVALPAEKKKQLRWTKPIDNVVVRDWDSLNKRKRPALIKYELVIACPYIAEVIETELGNSDPAVLALGSYLRSSRKRWVIFLIPTDKYIISKPSGYLVGPYREIPNKRYWRQNPRKVWGLVILPRMLTLIETCIGRKVWFEELPLGLKSKSVLSGEATDLMYNYLNKRAPKRPSYEIIVSEKAAGNTETEDVESGIPQPPGRWNPGSGDSDEVVPLACYKDMEDKYAAVKVALDGGGTAILLPFDANRIKQWDLKLILKLYTAMQESLLEKEEPAAPAVEIKDSKISETAPKRADSSKPLTRPIGSFSPPSREVPEVSKVIFNDDGIHIITKEKGEFVIKVKYNSNRRRAARLLIKYRLSDSEGSGYLTWSRGETVDGLTRHTLRTEVSRLNKTTQARYGIKFFRSARSHKDTGIDGWRFEPGPTYEVVDPAGEDVEST